MRFIGSNLGSVLALFFLSTNNNLLIKICCKNNIYTITHIDSDTAILVNNEEFGEIDSHSLCVDNVHVLERG